MIETSIIGSTTVAYKAIDSVSPNRREREKEAVGEIIMSIAGSDACLTHDAEGAPHLEGYHISVSHSRKMAVVALDAEREVGIDAEEWRENMARLSVRFLSDSEILTFTSPQQLLNSWTIKEAVYKIVGRGAVDFRRSIAIAPDMLSAVSCGHRFHIYSFDISDTHLSLVWKI